MALRTKAETARYLGVTNQYISTNIERKRLVVTKDGMIDDQNIINKDLIS